jgi:tRNA pseudouridine55 synthase
VQITVLQLVDWSPPQVTIDVECSAGTYIRSLAHDLGAALGVGAHLTGLIRAASGTFTLDTAVDLDTLLNAADWQRYLIGPEVALAGLPMLRFDVEAVSHLQRGRAVSDPTAAADRVAQAYGPDGELVAIIVGGSQCWHPHKVFKGSES